MSNYTQTPGDTQVRRVIRIAPHQNRDDTVELFVEGLKFRVGTIFDAAKHLRWGQPDSLVAKDPAARQNVDFNIRTRVSTKTYTNDEGQEKYYTDVVAIWGPDEAEPAEDNIGRTAGRSIRQTAPQPAPANDGALMALKVAMDDHERRIAELERHARGTRPAAPPPDDNLFDPRPRQPATAFRQATTEQQQAWLATHAEATTSLAAIAHSLYEPADGAPFGAPAADHMTRYLDALVRPATVGTIDKLLAGPRRLDVLLAILAAVENYTARRMTGQQPATAQQGANAHFGYMLADVNPPATADTLAGELYERLQTHRNPAYRAYWTDKPVAVVERALNYLLAGIERNEDKITDAMPYIWQGLLALTEIEPTDQRAKEAALNRGNNLIKTEVK